MKLTKRDIADIVLVWMGVGFAMNCLQAVMSMGMLVGMSDEDAKFINRALAAALSLVGLLVMAVVAYVLICKRAWVLRIIFPRAEESEVAVPDGLVVLTKYVFWIRLLGLFIFLKAVTVFVSHFAMEIAMDRDSVVRHFWVRNSGRQLVSAVFALLVIWRAEWIASLIEKPQPPNNAMEPTDVRGTRAAGE